MAPECAREYHRYIQKYRICRNLFEICLWCVWPPPGWADERVFEPNFEGPETLIVSPGRLYFYLHIPYKHMYFGKIHWHKIEEISAPAVLGTALRSCLLHAVNSLINSNSSTLLKRNLSISSLSPYISKGLMRSLFILSRLKARRSCSLYIRCAIVFYCFYLQCLLSLCKQVDAFHFTPTFEKA